jgi:hypothetical protein
MISDYQTGRLIFFDGDIGKYFYGTILSVAIDVTRNYVYMTVLNRNGEVCNLNLDKETMKQWSTSEPLKRSDHVTMQHN